MENDMVLDICKAISKYNPYSFNDLKRAYDICSSFDLLLTSMNLASLYNKDLFLTVEEILEISHTQREITNNAR